MILLMKFLIIACVVAMLRTSDRFQSMSRELDDSALSAMKRIMRTTEDAGFPPETVPVLILLTALIIVTAGVGR